MTAIASEKSRGGFLARFVLMRLPSRFKRMIYVSSIFGLIENSKDPDMELMTKLNEVLQLAKSGPKSCELPIHIRMTIWKNLDVQHMDIGEDKSIALNEVIQRALSIENCSKIGEQLAKSAPAWLQYGSVAAMAHDVVVLIKQLKKFHGQPRFAPSGASAA